MELLKGRLPMPASNAALFDGLTSLREGGGLSPRPERDLDGLRSSAIQDQQAADATLELAEVVGENGSVHPGRTIPGCACVREQSEPRAATLNGPWRPYMKRFLVVFV